MRALPPAFVPYGWALSTADAARIAGIEASRVLRFDGNTPPAAPPYATPAALRPALAEIQRYPHGGFPALLDALAEYAGVEPGQVVLGAGADDLLLLCARARSPEPATSSASSTSRPIRCSGSRHGSQAPRSATPARP